MGGGLELALGCHFRVATPDAQIALPEVKLGLLPGAGGTQRLPRVAGVETALNMIVSGAPVPARELAGTALFDEIVSGYLLDGALAFARKVVAEKRPLKRVRDIVIDYPNAEAFFQFARNSVAAMAKGLPAPLKCVNAVAAAVSKPFAEGLSFERAQFLELMQTAGIARAAARVLRRARGRQDSRPCRGHGDAQDRARRGRGRRDHGRRDRHEFPERRPSRHARRGERRGARQGRRRDPAQLRIVAEEGPPHGRGARGEHEPPRTDARLRRHRGRGSRHRSRVRGHGRQGARVPPAGRNRATGCDPRHQHVHAGRRPHRRVHAPAAGRRSARTSSARPTS